MLTELKIACRRLRKTPGFTCTALATLALCIGANLTIYAVVDGVLIRPLDFPHPDRLVTLYFTYTKLPSATNGASITSYYERRGKIPALASLSSMDEARSVVGEAGSTSVENLGRVTPEFFATLGVTPFMGRGFEEREMTYQSDHEAMLSYGYWRSAYNADPNVLGKTVRMDGIARVIVGILPQGFRFLSFEAPVYMPLSTEEAERNVGARHSLGRIEIARLADGITLAAAQAQVDAFDAAHASEFPQAKLVAEAGCHTVVAPLQADFVASVRPTLLLLQAAALFLLLIGSVNLTNLHLIRASNRARELGIRQALGASRRDVVRDVMTETLLLTLAGSLLGLGIGAMGVRLLAALGSDQLPLGAEISFNAHLAAAALVGATIVGLAIGGPVAWFNVRSPLALALQSESRGSTTGRAAQRLRHAFIVAQIALAFVLLTGAGLLGLSLKKAMAVSPGFRTDHVITGQFNLTWMRYPTLNSFIPFFDRLYEKTRSLPGVEAVGAVSNIPLGGTPGGNVMTVPGYVPGIGESIVVHDQISVAGDYFRALGIPLREGRYLVEADARKPEHLCVVDENLARHYWPQTSALGKQIYRGTDASADNPPFTIVGVVGSVKQAGLTDGQTRGAFYFPFSRDYNRNYFLVARTSLPPEALATTLARVVREVDPEVPMSDLRSMEVRATDSLATRRSPALMAAVFSVTALLLATVGLYGVMAYTVAQRTREFGVRIALGARTADIMRLVLGEGARLAAVGLTAGVLGAFLLTGYMSSMLFGVAPDDPVAFAGVAAVLAAVAGVACLLPARRATQVDPMVALRSE